MISLNEQIRELEKKSNKSKVKFQGDFFQELEKLMEKLEEIITKKIIPNYGVEYTDYGNYSIKIKIKDKKILSDKLIVCNLTYKKNDEKFGYIEPQFKISEKSQKNKIYNLEKFAITKNEEIIDAFIEKLIEIIEEF